jgi:hypothetical protein
MAMKMQGRVFGCIQVGDLTILHHSYDIQIKNLDLVIYECQSGKLTTCELREMTR